VVAVLPESPTSLFAPIELLGGLACGQMYGPGYRLRPAVVKHEQMDMVRGDHVVQDPDPEGLLGPVKPFEPSPFIFLEL
jgi:hypothetical protein